LLPVLFFAGNNETDDLHYDFFILVEALDAPRPRRVNLIKSILTVLLRKTFKTDR